MQNCQVCFPTKDGGKVKLNIQGTSLFDVAAKGYTAASRLSWFKPDMKCFTVQANGKEYTVTPERINRHIEDELVRKTMADW